MTWVAVAIALVVHGAILGTVHAFGLSIITEGLVGRGPAKPSADADDAELKATCFNDAVFAISGRAAMCLAPWVHDVDQCLSDAQMSLWLDLSSCQGRADPGTAIAMVEAKAVERLKPIDPEKLLEELRQDPLMQPPPPPPPPPPQPAMAQAAPPPPPPPPERPRQVIETVKPNQEKEPENTRFLAEYNTSAEKQKVSRGARNEPMVAKAKPEELTPKKDAKEDPSVKQKQPDRVIGRNEQAPDVPGKLSMRNPGALFPAQKEQDAKTRGAQNGAVPTSVADGYTQRKGDGAVEQERRERSEIPRGQNGAGGGAPEVPNLKPNQEVLERALGGGSVDHLEDVENSDETALSAKRWVYASFFNRLKRQVAQNWDPNAVWRRADPTGTVYGSKTRVTEVRVSLSPKGDLVKVLVTTPSGSVELDEEARRAFQAAAPFPNPPEGLIQKDNLITFAFGFYFQLGVQHLTWRLPQSM
ncbi:MAG: TonB C-terminal domain-containing protein [Deltaproteobacteria bacterium]|nr:MAG: TonB C-terminal domain-containing protein [Deltaproteobacteria bacterium]